MFSMLFYFIFKIIPFPFNFLLIIILIVFFIFISKLNKQATVLNKIQTNKNEVFDNNKEIKAFTEIHKDFNKNDFIKKVKIAFIEIQNAWSEKNINKVRRYISDGMYQRVITQFKMMDALNQKNIITDLKIINITIDKIESEGLFDTIHLAIYARIKDSFISNLYPNLNSKFYEEFVEYWTFIRKSSANSNIDMYSSFNCPNCGGDLSADMGDMCKCPYCGSITNSGEYDWVLSKITQADDYFINERHNIYTDKIIDKVEEISSEDENFAVQIIEDKVSNGYLQIETAKVFKDANYIKRFVTDNYLNKFQYKLNQESNFYYNRIFLNDVKLIGALSKDRKNILTVAVTCSYQRVIINNRDKAIIFDSVVKSKKEVVFISRDINAKENKGSIYAKQCSNCGGTILDTTNINCSYCGNILNSESTDWIISDIMTYEDYYTFLSENHNLFMANISPKKLEKIYKNRDYAFNNILVMIAADGIFEEEEIHFAKKLARKWGYSIKKIEGILDMAKNKLLVIRMPEDKKDKQKIYKLMEKAAAVDGNISAEERALLDEVKREIDN